MKRNCLVSITKRKVENTGELRGVRCVKVWPIKNINQTEVGKATQKAASESIYRESEKGRAKRKAYDRSET